MNLFIIGVDEMGCGGGFSLLVCANSLEQAKEIANKVKEENVFFLDKYPFYFIYEDERELGNLQEGDFRILAYYE